MSDRTYSATSWAAITPSDSATLAPVPVAIIATVAGDITAVGDDGVSAVFPIADGAMLTIQPHKIMATGTTATGLIALYN